MWAFLDCGALACEECGGRESMRLFQTLPELLRPPAAGWGLIRAVATGRR
ncbi:hypothetical protein L842_6289 [Mycobacterium intracellulare MIN_052511_1280]|nr:hypothetical protein L842_6289 [Mycobacterium intracellulare MIN_052511_1280]